MACLAPAAGWGVLCYGAPAAVVLAAAIGSALVVELAAAGLRHRFTLDDGSALLTGLLVGLSLPPGAPWYVAAAASGFAIAVVKQGFGGLGRNWMNPALAGRAFAALSWPAAMSAWLPTRFMGADAVSAATPLTAAAAGGAGRASFAALASAGGPFSRADDAVVSWLNAHVLSPLGMAAPRGLLDLLAGLHAGCIGEASVLLLAAGAAVLLWRRIIRWEIPAALFGTFVLLTGISRRCGLPSVHRRHPARRFLHGHRPRHLADRPVGQGRLRRPGGSARLAPAALRNRCRGHRARGAPRQLLRTAARALDPSTEACMNGTNRPAPPGSGGWMPWTIAAIVPSVAAASTLAAGLWLSAAAMVSALAAATLAALLSRRLPLAAASIAVLVLLAALAGAADRAAAAWLPAMHASLGVFLPITVVLLPGAVAASTLRDAGDERRIRRALSEALFRALAFLGSVSLIALVREVLGAGAITLPGIPVALTVRLPGISVAPARGLLLPLGGLIAAGYLAGLVGALARVVERRKAGRIALRAARPPEGGTP